MRAHNLMTMCVALYVGGLARQNSRAAGATRLLSHPGEAYSATNPSPSRDPNAKLDKKLTFNRINGLLSPTCVTNLVVS
jgi:hypothetical protein